MFLFPPRVVMDLMVVFGGCGCRAAGSSVSTILSFRSRFRLYGQCSVSVSILRVREIHRVDRKTEGNIILGYVHVEGDGYSRIWRQSEYDTDSLSIEYSNCCLEN